MADEGRAPRRRRVSRDDDPEDQLSELRRIAIVVFIALSVLVIVTDVVGRLFRDPTFHVDNVIAGLVFGTLLSLLGLEGIQKLLNGK